MPLDGAGNELLAFLRGRSWSPEYLHVLINPIPVYGLVMATLALVLAMLLRTQKGTIIALAIVIASALSAYPTYHFGEAAFDRMKAVSDEAGDRWLDQHMARGERFIGIFYVLAAISAVGIGIVLRWPGTLTPISVVTLALALTALGAGAYIAYPGGHIRHQEFRFESPPLQRDSESTNPQQ